MDGSLVVSQQRIEFSKSVVTSSEGIRSLVMDGTAKVELGKARIASMLEKSLTKSWYSLLKRPRTDNELGLNLNVTLVLYPPSPSTTSYVKVFNELSEDKFFPRLKRACGGLSDVTFQMELNLRAKHVDSLKLEGTELSVLSMAKAKSTEVGLIRKFKLIEGDFQKWNSASKVSGEFTLRLKLTDDAFQALQLNNLEDSLGTCRTIRADTSSTDASIIAGNGARVRCHKGFLSAHSPVFKTMFESCKKEGATSTVVLDDMTEAGVQALLDYLYCWDIKESCKSSGVAMDLLLAADKYNIPRLQTSLQELVLWKPIEWFSIPVAIQLLNFSKSRRALLAAEGEGRPEMDEQHVVYKAMEAKSVAVLRSKSADELTQCAEYRQIFEDAKMGMEFSTFVMLYPVVNNSIQNYGTQQ